MKLLLLLLISLFQASSVGAANLTVDTKSSKVDWHLYIDKGTDVYGEIPIISGEFDLVNKTGLLKFNLADTKSWEIEDGKREYSDARDDRIDSITEAKKFTPSFKFIDVIGYDPMKITNDIEIVGELSLKGKSRKIKFKANVTRSGENHNLKATHKVMWEKYDIDNPVIWFLRATSTPQEFITLNFDFNLK